MKFYDICTKKTFTSKGEEKSKWFNVGTLKVNDDGKQFIELGLLPNVDLYVFEQEDRHVASPEVASTEEQQSGHVEDEAPFPDEEDINVSQIPF